MGPSANFPEKLIRPVMPELNSIRGLAILLVLFFHGFGFEYGTGHFTGAAKLFMAATLPGWMGVNLFFVLSGFLITGILLESRNRPDYYRRFYTRRALRILPAYYALLIVLCFVPLTGVFLHRRITWPFIALSAIYLSNITALFGVKAQYAALWSLAVEEHFYLIWPAIVRKLSDTAVAIIVGVLVIACPIQRAITYKLGYAASAGYTWLVADGLALGALLAISLRGTWPERKLGTYFAVGLSTAGLLLLGIGRRFGILQGTEVLGATLRPSALNLIFGGLLAGALLIGTTRHRWLVNWRLLEFFGTISYGLYLIHMLSFDFVDYLIARFFPRAVVQNDFSLISLRFAVSASLAISVAYLSRTYFEEWFLRLKSRLGGSSAKEPGLAIVPLVTNAESVEVDVPRLGEISRSGTPN